MYSKIGDLLIKSFKPEKTLSTVEESDTQKFIMLGESFKSFADDLKKEPDDFLTTINKVLPIINEITESSIFEKTKKNPRFSAILRGVEEMNSDLVGINKIHVLDSERVKMLKSSGNNTQKFKDLKSQNLREIVYFYLLPSQVTYLPGAIVPVITKAGLLGRSLALHAANMKLYTLGFGREVSVTKDQSVTAQWAEEGLWPALQGCKRDV